MSASTCESSDATRRVRGQASCGDNLMIVLISARSPSFAEWPKRVYSALSLRAIAEHDARTLQYGSARRPRLRAPRRLGLEGVLGPVVTRIAAAHVLAHIYIGVAPEAREVARDL